jgi:hypothetical protein
MESLEKKTQTLCIDNTIKKKTNEVIKGKSDILMESLQKYYNENHVKFNTMLPIIQGRSNISLRVIDWFVTNYSKKFNISYKIKQKIQKGNKYEIVDTLFKVYPSYKSQLKAYSKRSLDPFCRLAGGEKYSFYYNKTDYIDTTAGQLNFFRWALENNVITFIKDNLDKIEKDMLMSTKNNQPVVEITKKMVEPRRRRISKKLKEPVKIVENVDLKKRRKRHELSKSALNGLNKHDCDIVINF